MTKRGADVRVLIVGAGIAGLAAARCVRDWGAAVEIVERTPGPATEAPGYTLPGNAVRALDAIGLGASVTERAVRIERQRTTDHRGRVLFDVDVTALWHGVGPSLALHRADLHQAMLAGVGDVPIRWGHALRAVRLDRDGVTAEQSDGSPDPMSAARYRERHTTSGAKSDPGDAHVLAEIVRLDREHHRPVAGDSGEVEGLKLIARTHQSLIWDRTRQLQRLRQALREYYPGLLEALAAAKLELGDPDAWSPRFVHNDRLVDALWRQARAAISASSEVRAFYDHLRAAALGTGCAAPIRERSGRDSARLPGLRLVLRGGHRLAPRRRPGGRPDRDRRSSRPPARAPWRTCLSGRAACPGFRR